MIQSPGITPSPPWEKGPLRMSWCSYGGMLGAASPDLRQRWNEACFKTVTGSILLVPHRRTDDRPTTDPVTSPHFVKLVGACFRSPRFWHRGPQNSSMILLFRVNLTSHNTRVFFSHHSFFLYHHDEKIASGMDTPMSQLGSATAQLISNTGRRHS